MGQKCILLFLIIWLLSGESRAQEPSFALPLETDQCNNMHAYLKRVAGEITDGFSQRVPDLETWQKLLPERRQMLAEMLGLVNVPLDGQRAAPPVIRTGRIEQEGFYIEKLYYESLPGLYVPANLYVPVEQSEPLPAILYLCGHARNQKAYAKYQGNARKFAQLGFVCLIIETLQFGEVEGEHWGTYANGWFNWISRGYHPGGTEVWNEIRAIDLLETLPEVDASRIGVTGPSGGGSQSWYLAAIDERVKAVAPVAGGETIQAEVAQKTVDEHCDCMMPHNVYQMDFADIGALIAPRPCLVAAPSRDGMFAIESVRHMVKDITRVYRFFGAESDIDMIEALGGHGTREALRPRIFSFFIRHLKGKEVDPIEIGDIDMSEAALLSDEMLAVYVDGVPADDRTTTIQNSFVELVGTPAINNVAELEAYRNQVVDFLKSRTFRTFPKTAGSLDAQWEYRAYDGAPYGKHTYSFVPEPGWRLKVDIYWKRPPEEKQPLALVLRSPGEPRWDSEAFARDLPGDLSVAYLEVRGVGETGWADNQQWYIRRAAAWTGRTIASMRTYDLIRGLEFLKSLPQVDYDGIAVIARGEMTVVALYAALMNSDVHALILKDPPATQDVASDPDGSGPAIETMMSLQITDLPQVAGILGDTEVYLLGDYPSTYDWGVEMQERLELPRTIRPLTSLSDWKR